jgi:hypothetical protein
MEAWCLIAISTLSSTCESLRLKLHSADQGPNGLGRLCLGKEGSRSVAWLLFS